MNPIQMPGTGFSGLVLQPGEKTVIKRNGLAERTSVFKCFGYPANVPIPLYTPYPDQSTGGFVCDSTTIEQQPGGFFQVTVVWVSLYSGPTQYITFESKLIQVPIDQSPTFTSIAGTPGSPLNGAVFDANGVFTGFGPGDYQGVVSAFIPQNMKIVRGTNTAPGIPDGSAFVESISNMIRGSVWEYEIVYNLDIDLDTGIPN